MHACESSKTRARCQSPKRLLKRKTASPPTTTRARFPNPKVSFLTQHIRRTILTRFLLSQLRCLFFATARFPSSFTIARFGITLASVWLRNGARFFPRTSRIGGCGLTSSTTLDATAGTRFLCTCGARHAARSSCAQKFWQEKSLSQKTGTSRRDLRPTRLSRFTIQAQSLIFPSLSAPIWSTCTHNIAANCVWVFPPRACAAK